MPHSRRVDADGVLVTVLSGTVTLQEFVEIEEELPGYAVDGKVYELVLHADDFQTPLVPNAARASPQTFEPILARLKTAAIAFVSSRAAVYGICRQVQMQVESECVQVRVFHAEEPARAWLREIQSLGRAAESSHGVNPAQ